MRFEDARVGMRIVVNSAVAPGMATSNIVAGRRGVIIEVPNRHSSYIPVQFDGNTRKNFMYPREIDEEVLTPATAPVVDNSFYMVYNPNGTTMPRVKHDTEAKATAEAERLSKVNVGHTFFVLRAISEHKAVNNPVVSSKSLVS